MPSLCDSCAKKLYSRNHAEKTVKYVLEEIGLELHIYPCPLGGFHLTSQGVNWSEDFKKKQKLKIGGSSWVLPRLNDDLSRNQFKKLRFRLDKRSKVKYIPPNKSHA